jgi:uncharacterized protein YjbJ (UPF0337 family)
MAAMDTARNIAQQAKGLLKEFAGRITGNRQLVVAGKADQVKGRVKQAAGKVKHAFTK